VPVATDGIHSACRYTKKRNSLEWHDIGPVRMEEFGLILAESAGPFVRASFLPGLLSQSNVTDISSPDSRHLVAPWPFFLPVSGHHRLLLPCAGKITERKPHHSLLKSQVKSPLIKKKMSIFDCETKLGGCQLQLRRIMSWIDTSCTQYHPTKRIYS